MSWHPKFILLTLICLSFHVAQAIIPFSGQLPKNLESRYIHIVRSKERFPVEALEAAKALASDCKHQNGDIEIWSTLIYTELLIENGSIDKAHGILSDTVNYDWDKYNSDLTALRSLQIGLLLQYRGNYKLAGKQFQPESTQNELLKLDILQAAADNDRYIGKLESASNKWYASREIAEAMNDSVEIVECVVGLAVVKYLQTEFSKAESELQIAEQFYRNHRIRKKLAYVYSILGLIKFQMDDIDGSIEYSTLGHQIRKEMNDVQGQGESLNNLALAYMSLSNWNQALNYLTEAIVLKSASEDLTQTAVILNNIGYCNAKLGNEVSAAKNYQLALATATANGQRLDRLTALRRLSSLKAKTGNHKAAYEFQRQYISLSDSINNEERSALLEDIEFRYESQKREQEIQLLQKEQVIITNRWLNLALGLAIVIILGALLFDSQRRKYRIERERLAKEEQLRKSELQVVTRLLEQNQQKLDEYTLNLLRKSEEVSQLEKKLNEFGSKHEQTDAHQEDFSTVRILTEDDWNEFKSLFDSVHSGLLTRLLRTFPSLTISEQRLFLLLKLGLTSKQISRILGVSSDTVKKSRYRLKKKLGITDSVSLQEFVNEF